jgi:ribosomal protein L11 methyltransferase
MYLWRRPATPQWWSEHEEILHGRAGAKLAVIEQPNRKRLQIELASKSRQELRELARQFGGRIEKLPRDWLNRFAKNQKAKPLKIGRRLVVLNVGGTSVSRLLTGSARSRHRGPSHIVIPAGVAFGTGEHATTAMSLRLLERLTRNWEPGWSIVDLGTGSGILALAAARLGAKCVLGLDNDPLAISTAKKNARLNKIDNVDFRLADVRRWKLAPKIDIVTANLFSELLVQILPKLKRSRWLILSGILRDQEADFMRALKRNKIDIVQMRRRGKWVALLAQKLRRS